MKVVFKVFRGNSSKNRHDEFDMEVSKGMTIMDCLNELKSHCDSSIAHRCGCNNGICGICTVKANGKPCLACKTNAMDAANEGNEITLEPLDRFPVIRDLVSDMGPFFDDNLKMKPWLEERKGAPEHENIIPQKMNDRIGSASDCIMCGACHSACIVLDQEKRFAGPASMVTAKRYMEDTRDAIRKERMKICNDTHSAWDCTHCLYCNEVCPVGIKPLGCISDVRMRLIIEGQGSRGATHHKAFLNSIEGSGILDESKYPIFAIGMNPFRLKEIIPVGFRMIKTGKAPDIMHKPIDKLGEVRKLFKEVKE
ncbi:MAG: 2Fe-2S iron-sulfur cluster-binding protein [Nanoarchaeota archaeon]